MDAAPPTHRPPPPWLFLFTCIPYGVAGTFSGVLMPYLAKRAHFELDSIGWFVTLLFIPSFLQFLYAPVVDFGPRRKYWLILLSFLAALSLFGALQMPLPANRNAFLAFAFAAQVFAGLISSANGGLMATLLTDAQRGKAGFCTTPATSQPAVSPPRSRSILPATATVTPRSASSSPR